MTRPGLPLPDTMRSRIRSRPHTRASMNAGLGPCAPKHLLVATSASRHVVDPLVGVNVGQDYRDLVNAGQAQADAARPTMRPA